MEKPGLRNIDQETLRQVLGNVCLAKAGLVIGSSSAAAVKIANTVTFAIDSVLLTKTTAEIAFTDVTPQPISTFAKYLVSLNAAGTGVITNGTPAASAALALLPDTPDDNVAIGYVQVATSGAGSFIPATTELSAAQVTDVYVDLMRNTNYN